MQQFYTIFIILTRPYSSSERLSYKAAITIYGYLCCSQLKYPCEQSLI